jgi:hypothetical protein
MNERELMFSYQNKFFGLFVWSTNTGKEKAKILSRTMICQCKMWDDNYLFRYSVTFFRQEGGLTNLFDATFPWVFEELVAGHILTRFIFKTQGNFYTNFWVILEVGCSTCLPESDREFILFVTLSYCIEWPALVSESLLWMLTLILLSHIFPKIEI